MALVDANLFPKIILRESANDGSDFSNPAADYRVLFLGEDGLLHVRDSSGTVSSPYSAGGGISSGTSNPGSPSNGDLFYRSDLDLLIRYRSSGTRWVTAQLFDMQFANDTILQPFSANGQPQYANPWGGVYDLWMENWYALTSVGTNDGSNFWTCILETDAGTDIVSFTTAADGTAKTNHTVAIGALLGTSVKWLQVNIVKTSSPGTLVLFSHATYRLVVT